MLKIRFIHIPKTAGASFKGCLRRIYKGKHFNFWGNTGEDVARYRSFSPQKKAKIAIFTGHCPRFTGIDEVDNLPIITILRDPVERVKSLCQHVREGKSAYLLKDFPPESFDLDKFLESGNNELSNLQTKMLLGDKAYILPDQDKAVIIKRAVDFLEKEALCFGIQEMFDHTLLLFRKQLGWQRWPVYLRVNTKNKAKLINFSQEHIDKIKRLNDIDIKVYNAAFEIFKKRIDQDLKCFQDNLELFNKYQKKAKQFLKIQESANRYLNRLLPFCNQTI
jgi:hypothetical protein